MTLFNPLSASLTCALLTGLVAQSLLVQAQEIQTLEDVDFPSITQSQDDQHIIRDLHDQGYRDIGLMRQDQAILISAQKAGASVSMIFSQTDGSLINYDGINLKD